MTTINWNGGDGDWNTAGNWTPPTVPGASDDAVIDAPGAYTVTITAPVSAGSIAIDNYGATLAISGAGVTASVTNDVTNAGNLTVQNGAVLTTGGDLDNSGGLYVDNQGTGGSNDSRIAIGGTLTNSGNVQVGNGDVASVLTAQYLSNTGSIAIEGGSTNQALLSVAADAPATWTGAADISGNGLLEFGGTGQIGSIDSSGEIYLDGPQAFIAAAGLGTAGNTALIGLTDNAGYLQLADGVVLTLDGTLTNTGYVQIGNGGLSAPASLTVQGLTNTGTIGISGGSTNQALLSVAADAPATWTGTVDISGNGLLEYTGTSQIGTIAYGASISLGGPQAFIAAAGLGTAGNTALTGLTSNAGLLQLADGAELTASGGLTNTGTIGISGDSMNQALLSVAADAPATWTGTVDISGNGLLEYTGTSQIGTIASNGSIGLSGPQAFVAAAGLGTAGNTALTGLTDNAGQLQLAEGAALTASGGLTNSGGIYVANSSIGGGSLTVEGTLTNSGYMQIGNSGLGAMAGVTVQGLSNTGEIYIEGGSTNQALLSVAADAPSVWTGTVSVSGNGLLEYAGTAGIGMIASGAWISLSGPQAFVTAADLGTAGNTALTGLTDNAGYLTLQDGAALTTSGGLANSGVVYVDVYGDSSGGSSLTFDGTLTNSGYVAIGDDYAAAVVMSQGLSNTGTINISGGSTSQALLNVAADAPTAWTGTVDISGNGLLEFGGAAGISSIASGARINLDGPQAFIAAAGLGTAGNTALTGLTSNAGQLQLQDGAALTTSGGLTNTGSLYVNPYGSSSGSSSLTVDGTLTNSGNLQIGSAYIGNGYVVGTVTAQGLNNTGTITVWGTSTDQALLNVAADAPQVWTGTVSAGGNGLLEFGGAGQIGAIASGAQINLDGPQAFIAAAGLGTAGNTALTGLTDNAGYLTLQNGAALSTSGGLANSGALYVDSGGSGGSSLTVDGTLTNSNYAQIGNNGLSAAADVTVQGLSNTGTIGIYGGSTNAAATLAVDGSASNSGTVDVGAFSTLTVADGNTYTQAAGTTNVGGTLAAATIDVAGGTLDFTNAVTAAAGTGNFEIGGNGTLEFGAAADAGHSVTFTSTGGTLELGAPGQFAPVIGGFAAGDTIDLQDTAVTGLSYANGVLTVTNGGAAAASLELAGNYSTSDFIFTSDNNGGNDVELAENAAHAAIEKLSGDGTLSQNGNNYTLDFGTVPLGSSAPTADLGVLNSAAPPADLLSGSFNIASNAAFSNGGFDAFSALAAGRADTAPAITLATGTAGTFSETITLSPDSVNAGGSTLAPNETLTVTGTVLPPSGTLSITAPASAAIGAGQPEAITGVSLSGSPVTSGETFVVTLADTNGELSAAGTGVSGAGTTYLAIMGPLSQVNSDLATLTDTDASTASDTITINAGDSFGNTAAPQSIAVSVTPPAAPPVINAPATEVVGDNVESPVDGISVEPGAGEPADTPITLTLNNPGGGLAFWSANGAGVASTQSASSVTLTGTAAYLNEMLSELVYEGGASSISISATEQGLTATRDVSLMLPATGNPDLPYALPVSVLLNNNNVTLDGNGTAALMQWDGYVGKVYVNLPLVQDSPALVGFAGMNDLDSPLGDGTLGMTATGEQEPFSPVEGTWNVALTGASMTPPSGLLYSLGTVTDENPQQADTITLTFNSSLYGPPGALPDRRIAIVFNKPGPTTVDNDAGDGSDDDGGDGGDVEGDVHLRTFDNLYYNFQAVGEFVLAKSVLPGDSFEVQIRTQPWYNSASVSVTTEAGTAVGNHRVTFDVNRTDTVWIDGSAAAAASLIPGGAPIELGAGALQRLTATSWKIIYDTGETVTVSNYGSFLNVSTTLPRNAPAGSVDGLLGNANGNSASDFVLPDGTILSQPLSYSDLYTTWANAWRVTQADSLLDYGPGQTTATFTDTNFPADATSLSSLPAAVVQNATDLAAAAGITDPAVAQGAALDYALTGDPAFLTAGQQGANQATPMPDPASPTPAGGIGIAAVSPQVTQDPSGTTEADFLVYRTTEDTSTPLTVNYTVLSPGAQYLGAGFFAGGVLPSGTVTIPAGASSTTLALDVTGSLGNVPSAQLEVGISDGAGSPPVLGSTAAATVVNNLPVAGNSANPVFLDPPGMGTLTNSGRNWTLALGTVSLDNTPPIVTLDIANQTTAPADTLFGNLQTSGSGVSFQNGLPPIVELNPGQTLPLTVTFDTTSVEAIDQTITFDANERNGSGYSASLGPVTLTITGAVEAAAAAAINTASPITFPNVHVGESANEDLSVANTAAAPAAALDVSFGSVPAGLTAAGSINALEPEATDATDLSVGLDTSSAGAKSGSIPVELTSDAGGGKTTPLPSQSIKVSGTVYRLAAASITPAETIVHVGDNGSTNLTVTNTDPADGYSENLIATLAGVSGSIGMSSGTTGEILPGATDGSTLAATFSTAQAGTVTGTATFDLTSDGGTGQGSIDGLGQTALPAQAVPLSITVNNYAAPAFEELSGGGTLTRNGNNYTLNIGKIEQNSGPLSIDLGVLNSAAGPADLLSGNFQLAGSAAFTANGFGAFSGLGAGQADSTPGVTLDTSATGLATETITLNPSGSNASGYSAALPAETLTIEADVENLPPPVITAPQSQTVFAGIPAVLGPLSIADPNTANGPVTVTISDGSGILAASASGSATVSGDNSTSLTLTGDLADVNTELASVTYAGNAPGSEAVEVAVSDAERASASQSIDVTTNPVPVTAPVLNAPSEAMVIAGTQTGLGGLSVSDPYAEATGQQISVEFTTNAPLIFNATGSGGTVTGEGTNDLTITGTPSQINSYFADGFSEGFAVAGESLADLAEIAESTEAVLDILLKSNQDTTAFNLLSALKVIPEGYLAPPAEMLEVGISAVSFGIESILSVIPGNGEAPDYEEFEHDLYEILAGKLAFVVGKPHILTADGLVYDFNAVGEFVLAVSTQPGNSFDVQIRLQPDNGSQSASIVTQIAASVGSDRITFDATRAGLVWVDGSPVTLTLNTPFNLSGGQVTQKSDNVYQLSWNTGEVLTVVNEGGYLSLSVGLGSGDGPGMIAGLMGPNMGQADDFTLPDGTVLPQPLTSNELYGLFANAWRVPQADSLFDYGLGQSTATFTDVNFPKADITLADLPASIVAKAAQVVAAAGITDPGAAAAAEFDYIVSGGDSTVVASDASLIEGRTTTQATITPSGPAPAVLGVIADEPTVVTPSSGPAAVTFDLYLTAAGATGTAVNYAVIAPNSNDLDAEAFGGTLPTGTATILAGQTSAQFTIDVPQGALGHSPSATLEVSIAAPGGVPLLTSTGQATVVQPEPGPAPVPELSYLGTIGTFVANSSTSYTLDLGAIQLGEPVLPLQFSIANAATAPADQLTGTFTVDPVMGFEVTGDQIPAPIDADQSYAGLYASVDPDKFGDNSETITFDPIDANASGYSAPLPAITLTIADTLELPGITYSEAWGDVHIVTYNGLTYNFQAEGEFTLAKSKLPGDSFDIQMRLEPWSTGSSVTVIRQVAIQLGSDSVTFDWTRTDPVWVDGTPSVIGQAQPELTLSGGTVTEVSPDLFKVNWNTGETMTVTNAGSYINIIDGVPPGDLAGGVAGLQGEAEGASNDFQLAGGTVLPQPLSSSTLYGEYADSWRVSQATSLFNYGPGQNTSTFTDTNFPADNVTLADLPASVVSEAASMTTAAGITDPGIAQAAELDYLATGDPSFIASAETVQQNVVATSASATVTQSTPPAPAIGVSAVAQSVTEAAADVTPVTFTAYLTGAEPADTVVDYTVVAAGAGYLGAGVFGGTLPSGQVTITQGQTTAPITIDVPEGALGTVPSENLQLQVSDAAGIPVFAPAAQTEILNDQPEPGSPAIPELSELSGGGTLTFDPQTNTYTLNLGTLTQNSAQVQITIGVINTATAPADSLGGAFTAPLGNGFLVIGDDLSAPIAAGHSYDGLSFTVQTGTPGTNSVTLSLDPKDVNDSGYSSTLPPITLKIEDMVAGSAQVAINTPDTIVFPNVHVGGADSQHISVTNTATAPAATLDVTPYANGNATATGSVSLLAPGATDATSLSAGLDTSVAGARSGMVDLDAQSDAGNGSTSPILPSPTVDLFGAVYNLADPSVLPASITVHVGDPGTQPITITNLDPNNGYSENLIATVTGTTGALTTSGTAGDIDPQSTGTIAVNFSTAAAGSIGTVTLSLESDGTGIDGLGMTSLGDVTIPVVVDALPSIAAPDSVLVQQNQASPVSGIGVSDANARATVTVTLTDSAGFLSASTNAAGGGGTISGNGSTSLGIAGTLAQVNADLGTLTDQDSTLAAETITVNASDSTGGTATPATISVAVNAPPVIAAPGSVLVLQNQATAVAGISVADADAASAGETITVTLTDTSGLLSASGAGTITGAGTASLTIAGTLAQVNADLAALTDKDASLTADTIAVNASDSRGGAAVQQTVAVAVNPAVTATVTINPVDGNNVINYAEAHATGGVPITGTETGLAADAAFAVSVQDGTFSKTYTAAVGANGTWSATIPSADAVTLPDGTATVTAEVTSSVCASEPVIVAETLPTVTINKINGNDIINNSACGGAHCGCGGGHGSSPVLLTGTVTGIVANSTFQVTVTDSWFSKSYTATVNAAGTGWSATMPALDVAQLPNGTAAVSAQVMGQDGNVSLPATQLVTVEGTAPVVLSVSASPSTGDLKAGKTVAISLTMSEPVVVKGTPTLSLNDCGAATFDAAHSTSTVLVFDYTVAAGQNTAALKVTGVNLPCGASIKDLAGDNANLAGADVTLGLQIDTTPPAVTGVKAAANSKDLNAGKMAQITLAMSEPVTVSGAPTLALNDGGTATYDAALSSASALTFDYTVLAGQNTTALTVTGVTLANGASIQDLAGNAAVLTGADVNLGLQIDTVTPAVSTVTASPAKGTVTTGGTVAITLKMNEAVTVAGTPVLLLNDGGTATYSAANSTATSLVFDYTVPSSQGTRALSVIGLELGSPSAIEDGAGNIASLSGAAANLGLKVNSITTGPAGLTISGTSEAEIFGASSQNAAFASGADGVLKLDSALNYTGSVSGLTANDTLDLSNLAYGPNMTVGYSGTAAGGALSIGNGSQAAHIALLGNYLASSFTLSGDGHGGTNVVDPPMLASVPLISSPKSLPA